MKTTSTFIAVALCLVLAGSVSAQASQDLEDAVNSYFVIESTPFTRLEPVPGLSFYGAAAALATYMHGKQHDGSTWVATFVSQAGGSSDVVWGTGTVNYPHAIPVIVIATASVLGGSAVASVDTSGSIPAVDACAYAIAVYGGSNSFRWGPNGGLAIASVIAANGEAGAFGESRSDGFLNPNAWPGGGAMATNTNGRAFAAGGSGGHGGFAEAENTVGGAVPFREAAAVGGLAVAPFGVGGSAAAQGPYALAYGGDSQIGNGGFAEATCTGGDGAIAIGGDALGNGDGGDAEVYCPTWALGINAVGGTAYGSGKGGDAYTEGFAGMGVVDASAYGGESDSGDGGSATVIAHSITATAEGGDADHGVAGDATLTNDGGFGTARGGNSVTGTGGAATAAAADNANAYGGDGNVTQLVTAASVSGDAYAEGGTGIGTFLTPADGGEAHAIAQAGRAEARGGNGSGMSTLGGLALADGSLPGVVVDDPAQTSSSTGGHAVQN